MEIYASFSSPINSTPPSQVLSTPRSATSWMESARKREQSATQHFLTQNRDSVQSTRRTLHYSATSSSSTSSSLSSAPNLAAPFAAATATPPARSSSSSSSSSSSPPRGVREPAIPTQSDLTDAVLTRDFIDLTQSPLPVLPVRSAARRSGSATPEQKGKPTPTSVHSCLRPAPPAPTPDRSVRPVPGLLGRSPTNVSTTSPGVNASPVVGRGALDSFDLRTLHAFEPQPMTPSDRDRIGQSESVKRIALATPRTDLEGDAPRRETYHQVRAVPEVWIAPTEPTRPAAPTRGKFFVLQLITVGLSTTARVACVCRLGGKTCTVATCWGVTYPSRVVAFALSAFGKGVT
eukprot:g63295.t1